MIAGAGYRNWTPGDVPTATQFDQYFQEQVIMRFADTAARDTALSVPKAEGMYAYAVDINTLHFYNGTAWEIVHEPPQTWNVTSITQSGSVSCTTNLGWYQRCHGVWRAQLSVTITAAGSAGSAVVVATPFTLTSVHSIGGAYEYIDTGTGAYAGSIAPLSTTTMQFRVGGATGTTGLVGVSPSFATANTDILRITAQGTY